MPALTLAHNVDDQSVDDEGFSTRGGIWIARSWLILDPKTYQLLGGGMQGAMAGNDGKPDITEGGKESSAAVVTAQWTDQRPVAPHGR